MEERKIKTVTLTLTQACNLSCTYCYEHHKSNRRMSVETAKSIVDYELKNFADFEGIEFDLFGGEPFLAFDLVREITDYISISFCNYTSHQSTMRRIIPEQKKL